MEGRSLPPMHRERYRNIITNFSLDLASIGNGSDDDYWQVWCERTDLRRGLLVTLTKQFHTMQYDLDITTGDTKRIFVLCSANRPGTVYITIADKAI